MNKIGLIVTSTSGIDYENINFNLKVLRLTLIVDDKEYIDYKEMKSNEFYNTLLKNPDINIKTSQPSIGVIEKLYQEYIDEGYNKIVVITLSKALSGTYQACLLAKNQFKNIDIEIIDTNTISIGELYLANKTIEMINNHYEFKDIINKLNILKLNINIYLVVDTLKYLIKNGRLSTTKGFIANLLKIKPILAVTNAGNLKQVEVVRTSTKALDKMIKLIINKTKNINCEIYIAYSNNYNKALKIKDLLLNETKHNIKLIPLTPVIGVHAGYNCLGIGYVKLD